MKFYADLHIHSKYSRATSKSADLENLALWACKKGVTVVGTGDFTHPKWFEEIKTKLIPEGNGLFKLRPEIEDKIFESLSPLCRNPIRFLLTVEISTIYKKGDKVRKIHHIIHMPDLESAERFNTELDKIGNIASDGRPILGLDSRNLLEIALECSNEKGFLVPAHIWTPWFAVMGSKSGFDSIEECYGDLSEYIFALETGLSSDPYMNWKISSLDKYRLVSNSDAHSPKKLGREATILDTEVDYFKIRDALRTGEGYVGTVEFFPEEGKYYMDGHRSCNLCLEPKETLEYKGICPACGGIITVGVMHRVNKLADKKSNAVPPKTAGQVVSLIPLEEIVSEIKGCGVLSQKVQTTYENLILKLGPELDILRNVSIGKIRKLEGEMLAEAISRLRKEKVIRQSGYDGEYGVIRLFSNDELKESRSEKSIVPKKITQRKLI